MDTTIVVCVNERFGNSPSCGPRGAVALGERLEQLLAEQGLDIPVKRILCFGRCKEGPVMRIAPGGRFFTGVTEERLAEVVVAAKGTLLVAHREGESS